MNIIFSDIISLSMFTCMKFPFRLAHFSWLFMPFENFFYTLLCSIFISIRTDICFRCNSLPQTLVYKIMTQPGLVFIFKIKKTCTTLTKDLNVYAFTRNSSSVLEIAGQYKNYGTVYIISTISMHVDLTVVYVHKVQCTPFFF